MQKLCNMDFTKEIYYAARDGRVQQLKCLLEYLKETEETGVAMFVAAKTHGATPLVIACRNGHYGVAEFLIQKCNANIEQPGSVVFDGETIEGAPPLWCAAAVGCLDVVKLLIKHGACVNSKTTTDSTPLRAACFDGHFEVVKFLVESGADIEIANRHGHTCLMIASYKKHYKIAKYLLSIGADINRKTSKGNTALHDCAESGSLEILKMLMAHGAKMDVDSYGMTPLLSASVTGHTHIVEYLIRLPELISRSERLDALELLGATYVDKKRDLNGALELWRRAMHDRLDSPNKLPKPPQLHTVAAYDHVREINDLESLENLLAEPDQMRMQALVIRERILGPAHPDTSYYIRYRGAIYADAGNLNRCIELWNHALDLHQSTMEPLNQMTQSSLLSFTELFSYMLNEENRTNPLNRGMPIVSFSDVATVYIKAINEVKVAVQLLEKIPKFDRHLTCLDRVVVIALHLGCLLTKEMAKTLPEEKEELKQTVYRSTYQFVKLGVKGKNGRGVLHLACSRDTGLVKSKYTGCQFPSASLVQLLLKVGADPKAKDDEGNTPLHLATAADPIDPVLITALLDHGAHIDSLNYEKKSIEIPPHILNPIKYQTLACLAAKTLGKYTKKEYYINKIPRTLISFVEDHC